MRELLEPADPRGGNRALTRPSEFPTTDAVSPTPPAPARVPTLLLDRVSKWYGPVIGLNQVTLELRPGITGLVGHNGAGKSTLIKLATGQLRPDLGSVRVAGHDAWTAAARSHVGYCPEVDRFYEEMSGEQFVLAMARLCGYSPIEARRRTARSLELVGMAGRADRRIRGYSKGMRQRIKLAQALIHEPELLVLDEPLSGIDPVGRAEFVALFRRLAGLGKCLLISSHELDELEKLTDHVIVMARGRIAAVGTLAQIRELLDHRPLTICLETDRPRALASVLLGLSDVIGIDLQERDRLTIRARNPRQFFRELSTLVLEEDFEIRHLEAVDESANAILGYLLGAGA